MNPGDLAPAPRPSILIVDDTPENIDVLREALKADHTVRPALNGATALKIAHASPPPDLILLDIMMPGMDGYQVIDALRQSEATRDIPVIFITALADMANEIRGLQAGAVDYITKPFNPLVVRSRVATHLDLRRARHALQQHNEELLQDRQLVEDIIARMRAHPQFTPHQLRYLMAPVERANGDILLSALTPEGGQWVLVGDFTGHGLRAALAAPLVAQVFYSGAASGRPIEDVIVQCNEILYRQLPTGFFMATSIVDIAPTRQSLRLWSGGMPEALLFDQHQERPQALGSTGLFPLGIVPELELAAHGRQLAAAPGDRLYIFSDGVTELANPQGEFFGISGIENFLLAGRDEPLLDDVMPLLAGFHGAPAFDDDITLIEIRL